MCFHSCVSRFLVTPRSHRQRRGCKVYALMLNGLIPCMYISTSTSGACRTCPADDAESPVDLGRSRTILRCRSRKSSVGLRSWQSFCNQDKIGTRDARLRSGLVPPRSSPPTQDLSPRQARPSLSPVCSVRLRDPIPLAGNTFLREGVEPVKPPDRPRSPRPAQRNARGAAGEVGASATAGASACEQICAYSGPETGKCTPIPLC